MATRRQVQHPDGDVDGSAIQRAIQGTITGAEIISVGVLNLVRNTVVTALSGARDVGGELGATAVVTVRGTIKAAHDIGGDLGAVAQAAARGAVRAASEVGGDVAVMARTAVEGAIHAAREIGGDVGMAARNAASGAIDAADRIGTTAGRAVRETVGVAVESARRAMPGGPASVPDARLKRRRRTVARRSRPRTPRRQA